MSEPANRPAGVAVAAFEAAVATIRLHMPEAGAGEILAQVLATTIIAASQVQLSEEALVDIVRAAYRQWHAVLDRRPTPKN